MYTRFTTFPIKPDSSEKAREIGEKYAKVLHDQPGHCSTVMIMEPESFISISTWDTQEHAEAIAATRNDAQADLADLLTGAPSTSITSTVIHDVA